MVENPDDQEYRDIRVDYPGIENVIHQEELGYEKSKIIDFSPARLFQMFRLWITNFFDLKIFSRSEDCVLARVQFVPIYRVLLHYIGAIDNIEPRRVCWCIKNYIQNGRTSDAV